MNRTRMEWGPGLNAGSKGGAAPLGLGNSWHAVGLKGGAGMQAPLGLGHSRHAVGLQGGAGIHAPLDFGHSWHAVSLKSGAGIQPAVGFSPLRYRPVIAGEGVSPASCTAARSSESPGIRRVSTRPAESRPAGKIACPTKEAFQSVGIHLTRRAGNRTHRQRWLPSAVILFTLATTSCSHNGGVQAAPAALEARTVAVAIATRADLSSGMDLTAEFEPYQEVDVMAKVSGYIREIKVDIGDRVAEGQLLATLEVPEMQDDLTRGAAAIEEANAGLSAARDELQRDESAHDMAHLSYTRILEVSQKERGLVPQQQVDEVHSRDLVAEAQVSAAKSHIAAGQQRIHVAEAEQARYKTMLQYARITAPFAGVVTRRYANTGSLIQAGTSSQTQAMPVVRLSQNSILRLQLPVPESAVPMVRLGEPVDVKVSALSRTFPGVVKRFADKVESSTRTMKTEVEVLNPNLTIVPGMYAEVDLITEQRAKVLAVPVEAIDGAASGARVFAVRSTGTVEIVPVHLGLESAHLVEIRSGEIHEGDQVVVGPRASLKQGDKVQPKTIALAAESAPKP
jgi:RND family efflux transporter MFP subunit